MKTSLSQIEKELQNQWIVQIDKGTLVNLYFCKKIIDDTMLLVDGTKLIISRRRSDYVGAQFFKYMFDRNGK